MPTVEPDTGRFSLPARIRVKGYPVDGNTCHSTLAERLRQLPFVHVVEDSAGVLPLRINAYLEKPIAPARKQHAHTQLCRIASDGLTICGLADWDRYQVLAGRWGKLQRDRVLMYLPRDDDEIEVCWTLVQRAYASLSDSSVMLQAPHASRHSLPSFSRTTLL